VAVLSDALLGFSISTAVLEQRFDLFANSRSSVTVMIAVATFRPDVVDLEQRFMSGFEKCGKIFEMTGRATSPSAHRQNGCQGA